MSEKIAYRQTQYGELLLETAKTLYDNEIKKPKTKKEAWLNGFFTGYFTTTKEKNKIEKILQKKSKTRK